ncbi:MAG: hypothetical protein D6732_22470 [Methanobacteriota archaeon]|nr:MAG: hypothetical protein D6732_22470 [Euryarchaeota archaeon]
MAWDASLKNFLKMYLDADITTEFDVPTANLRLDFLMRNAENLPLPFSYAHPTILGEFKSERDKFRTEDFYRGLAKAYLHFSTMDHEKNITLLFLLGGGVRPPPELLEKKVAEGIWEISARIHVLLVELDLIVYDKSNQFLRLFASKEVRRPLIVEALREKETFITSYSYFLYKDEVMEVAQAENIEVDPRSLSIRSAVESIGVSRVIEEIGLDRVIEEIGLDRVIEEIGLDRVIEEIGLDRVIEEIGLHQVIEEIGLDRVIKEVGIEDLVQILTPEQKEQLRKLLNMG